MQISVRLSDVNYCWNLHRKLGYPADFRARNALETSWNRSNRGANFGRRRKQGKHERNFQGVLYISLSTKLAQDNTKTPVILESKIKYEVISRTSISCKLQNSEWSWEYGAEGDACRLSRLGIK